MRLCLLVCLSGAEPQLVVLLCSVVRLISGGVPGNSGFTWMRQVQHGSATIVTALVQTDISTATGQIAMKFGTDIRAPQRMKPADFGDLASYLPGYF